MNEQKCPFKVGDMVKYSPTLHGRGHVAMTEYNTLKPGTICRIVNITNDFYLVIEGYENATGGGIYWSEFKASAT
jgi:hypothetical protein